jgi:hypothetical protein
MALPKFPVTGGCTCGQVRYTLSAPPLTVYNCYCKDCQRASGAACGVSVVSPENTFSVTGEVVTYKRTAHSGNVIGMNFCSTCYSWLWNDPSVPGAKVVRAGTLDDMNWAKPIGNIWTDSAASWAPIDPHQVNFPKGPPSRAPLIEAWEKANEV